jgi:hypothetical protein
VIDVIFSLRFLQLFVGNTSHSVLLSLFVKINPTISCIENSVLNEPGSTMLISVLFVVVLPCELEGFFSSGFVRFVGVIIFS